MTMARCETGYLCDVCGGDVEAITDSDLYLRFILGEVPPEKLHAVRERHIRCNPAVAQFIVDPGFPPVRCGGAFAKANLDAEFVAQEESRVTRGWRRLQEIPSLDIPLTEYPLPEVRQAHRQAALRRDPVEGMDSASEYEWRMRGYQRAAAEEEHPTEPLASSGGEGLG
jgi:hypothetical protein